MASSVLLVTFCISFYRETWLSQMTAYLLVQLVIGMITLFYQVAKKPR